MSKSIRVSEETHAMLTSLKSSGETYDDLLKRFVRERRELIRPGARLWEGTDAAEQARQRRMEMKDNIVSP